MLSKETFHSLEDMKSVLLMKGQVSITWGLFFWGERSFKLQFES